MKCLRNINMMKKYIIYTIALVHLFLVSCDQFLDKKSDMKMAIPLTLEDGQALLDNYSVLNQGYPYIGELCADNFQLTDNNWNTITIDEDRDLFVWDTEAAPVGTQWSMPYRVIYNANQVLSMLDKLQENAEVRQLRGKALFFRAYAHLSLAELFVDIPKKDKSNAHQLAIPYRTTPNIEENSPKVTQQVFFDFLISDMLASNEILNENGDKQSRPSKKAILGLLARTYLYLQDYEKAGNYADQSLAINNELLDFNLLSPTSNTPIPRFNREVLFQAISSGSATFSRTKWKVNTELINTYDENDLRKMVFFIKNSDGTYSFKGNYDGVLNQAPFSGLAVDEMYLIRAEAHARLGKTTLAVADMNTLLRSRWRSGTYVDYYSNDEQEVLRFILTERRKELIMRQRRWADLKRLNLTAETSVTLRRTVNGKQYELKPNAYQYTFLIPFSVINNSLLTQTVR